MGMQVGGGGGGELNSDINVTPLVDVMLVLLVIFMITAPMMNTGVELELPETKAAQIEDAEGKLVLSIDQHSRLLLGSTAIRWEELQEKLELNERVKKEKALYVEAHKDLPYNVVVTAMATAKEAGVVNVMMLTNPSEHMNLAELDKRASAAPPLKQP